MARMVALGIVLLSAVLYAASGKDRSFTRTCEDQVGLTPGTAEFGDCYAELAAADAEAKSLVFGGLIGLGG